MGYPSNVLAADERVVLHRHPHWKRLIGPVLILLVVTAVAAFGAGFVNQTDWQSTAKNVVLLVILAVWLVIVGWLTVWPFFNWWTTHFVITDRRVMFRHGAADPIGHRHSAGADQQRRVSARLAGPDVAHRHVDHRIGVARSPRVPRHSARGAGALTAVSRSLRHPGLGGIAELSQPAHPPGGATQRRHGAVFVRRVRTRPPRPRRCRRR